MIFLLWSGAFAGDEDAEVDDLLWSGAFTGDEDAEVDADDGDDDAGERDRRELADELHAQEDLQSMKIPKMCVMQSDTILHGQTGKAL